MYMIPFHQKGQINTFMAQLFVIGGTFISCLTECYLSVSVRKIVHEKHMAGLG